VLEKRKNKWKLPKINKPKMNFTSVFKKFFKNLIYLFRHNLNDLNEKNSSDDISLENLDSILECLKYEISDEIKKLKKPKIKSPEETLQQIL